jgi:hypothetical protein
MPRAAKGYIEQLPSGSFRVTVYVGTDPLTGRAIRLKATAKTEQQARIELGRLLKDAYEGRTPESAATVATLLEEYALIAPWDVSTRQTNEGFIRRTIKPALGHIEVRKVRGPILDQLYARLKRCGDLSCTGRPFIEHRNFPALVIKPKLRPIRQAISGLSWAFTGFGRMAFWLLQGERNRGAEEAERLALGAGRFGEHRDGDLGAGVADLVAGQGGQVLEQAAEAVVGLPGRIVLV